MYQNWIFLWIRGVPVIWIPAGHSEEASEQRPVWAAVTHRRSLWVQEEGGGGAHRPQGEDRKASLPPLSPVLPDVDENCWDLMCDPQEKRRAERAEQQRIRAERDKERQARREVCSWSFFCNQKKFRFFVKKSKLAPTSFISLFVWAIHLTKMLRTNDMWLFVKW